MSQEEVEAFWHTTDSDHEPCVPEPPELIEADWHASGDLE